MQGCKVQGVAGSHGVGLKRGEKKLRHVDVDVDADMGVDADADMGVDADADMGVDAYADVDMDSDTDVDAGCGDVGMWGCGDVGFGVERVGFGHGAHARYHNRGRVRRARARCEHTRSHIWGRVHAAVTFPQLPPHLSLQSRPPQTGPAVPGRLGNAPCCGI